MKNFIGILGNILLTLQVNHTWVLFPEEILKEGKTEKIDYLFLNSSICSHSSQDLFRIKLRAIKIYK